MVVNLAGTTESMTVVKMAKLRAARSAGHLVAKTVAQRADQLAGLKVAQWAPLRAACLVGQSVLRRAE